jgi:hypothetical protein
MFRADLILPLTIMRKLLFLFMLFSFAGYSQSVSDFTKVEWLIGTWNRTDITKHGRTGHEQWIKTSETELKGLGIIQQENDTLFVEKITILLKDGNLYYVADVAKNKVPVYFKFIELTATGFVCENTQHDFPKRISYQVEGSTLKAVTSGNGKSAKFIFEKAD